MSEEIRTDEDVDIAGGALKDAFTFEADASVEGVAIENGDIEDDNVEDDDPPNASDVVVFDSDVVV